MKSRKVSIGALALAAAFAVLIPVLPADPTAAYESGSATEILSEIAPEVLDDAASDTSLTETAVNVEADNGSTVEISLDPSMPALLDSGNGLSMSVTLPLPEQTSAAEITEDGFTVFDHNNGASSVPIVKEDGSIQIATVITDAVAPARYEYELDVPGLSEVRRSEDGGLLLLDAEGGYLAGVAEFVKVNEASVSLGG